jgi:riboflavin synthase
MFSGIVRGCYPVLRPTRKIGQLQFAVGLEKELIEKLNIGSSVAVNGACLTVAELEGSYKDSDTITGEVSFDVIAESIRVTNLKDIVEGDLVNIELSISTQSDISGHIVSGHVDGVATIKSIEIPDENNYILRLAATNQLMKYIFPKGFIALNGCSLTVGSVDRDNDEFSVYLIPETLRRTNLKSGKVGDNLNLEVERYTQAIVDTVSHFMNGIKDKLAHGGLSSQDLEEMLISHLTKRPQP